MPTETTKFDIQDHLKSDEQRLAYLEAALEDGDAKFVAVALGDIARAKGMSAVARDSGLTREALYKALSEKGDPKLSTLFSVVKALGLKVSITA
ncbi:putative addiction module antidote protein [Rhizobium sp. PP-CC-2G-626]|nr:putative addiction module antidote protein [Rhizobium sp. PP-CC-2G-626]